MAILDSFTNKTGLFWRGLILSGLSFSIFFGTLWYAIVPATRTGNGDIWNVLSASVPWLVGSLIFMAIGAYMTLEGKKIRR